MSMLSTAKAHFDRLVNSVVVVLMLGMILATFLQVVGRYVFSSPPNWSEELARYLSVWVVFLGSSIAFRTGSHLGVDFFVQLLPRRWVKIVTLAVLCLLAAMLAIIAAKGLSMAQFVSRQLSPAMRLSMALPYAAIPTGSALMLLEVLIQMAGTIRGREDS